MAAGTSSRFVPLSTEFPKGLLEVKGEVLIERQIRQLQAAGITDIVLVVGYKAEMFNYLEQKLGVQLVMNEDFDRYNNTSSIIRVLDKLGNTYICSSDNYFPENVFQENPDQSYYSALYTKGPTDEYCITTDSLDNITSVSIGGNNSWYMIGHAYFSEEFSVAFRKLLLEEYRKDEIKLGYWEDVYIRNIPHLPFMKIHRYGNKEIEEFDSLDELRKFDESYLENTRSTLLKEIANRLNCGESDLSRFHKLPQTEEGLNFSFEKGGSKYEYHTSSKALIKL